MNVNTRQNFRDINPSTVTNVFKPMLDSLIKHRVNRITILELS